MPEPGLGGQVAGELRDWAARVWPDGNPGELNAQLIEPDGSTRLFMRLSAGKRHLVALANPDNPPENRAWAYFAQRLAELGLPVAKVLSQDRARGFFLMEDLGHAHLQAAVKEAGDDAATVEALYEPVLRFLIPLHQRGGQGLDHAVCFDGAELDATFLLKREAGYFLEQYVKGAAGRSARRLPMGLDQEMVELCHRAAGAQPWGLVHRDLQSRNIILEKDRYGLVDFQGARLGPVAYDLASLLHDPYVNLPWGLRERLVKRYAELAGAMGSFDRQRFLAGWPWVSASRLMQALGAYGFLSREMGKGAFIAYMRPALAGLGRLAQARAFADFPAWRELLHDLLR
jgi:hypothetical protein